MAAEPIPMPEDNAEVTIAADGTVSGLVAVNNGGVVKFQVSGYPTNPPGTNTCIVTITSANITWAESPAAGQNSIKVGN